MAGYRVVRPIIHNGVRHEPGDAIELTDSQAAQMINGQIEKAEPEEKAEEKPAKKAKAKSDDASAKD